MLQNGFHAVPAGKVAMIVTHLEMRARPELKSVSLPEGVTFRRVNATPDWFRDIFLRVGSMEWLWYGRLKMDTGALSALFANTDVEHYTLTKDGQDEALLELDFRKPGACELAYFGVAPALMSTGCGRYLMNAAVERAWSRDIQRFHVHTCTFDSPKALSFYRRSGFTPIRQEVEIDDDPRILGLLPHTAGPNVPIFDHRK